MFTPQCAISIAMPIRQSHFIACGILALSDQPSRRLVVGAPGALEAQRFRLTSFSTGLAVTIAMATVALRH